MPDKRTEQPWERQKGESAQAFEAFLTYLQMEPRRSLNAVGQRLGKSRVLMERWSSANHWAERVRAWDNHLQQEARRAAVSAVREMNRRHAKMALQIQGAALKALTDMGPDMVNPKNFAAVVRMAVELERDSLGAEAAALGGDAAQAAEKRNNLLEAIMDVEEMDTSDLPEVE